MGGGGKSSSQTINHIDVKPVTNINLDEVAEAIRESTSGQLQADETKIALAKAGLELELQEQELEKTKILTDITQTEKTRKQITTVLLLVGGIYVYNKMKKGGKK